MKQLLILALLLLPASAESLQTPVKQKNDIPIVVALDGPTKVDSGGFSVSITAPENAVLRWKNDIPSDPDLKLRDANGQLVWVWLQPKTGKYSFYLSAQIESPGLDPFAEDSHVVTVGDEQDEDEDVKPDPGPKPEPGPKPDGKLWAIVIEETENRTPQIAQLIADTDYRNELQSKDITIRFYDETLADVSGYMALLNKHNIKTPALVLVKEDGTPLFVGPVPEDFKGKIKEVTGR